MDGGDFQDHALPIITDPNPDTCRMRSPFFWRENALPDSFSIFRIAELRKQSPPHLVRGDLEKSRKGGIDPVYPSFRPEKCTSIGNVTEEGIEERVPTFLTMP